MLNKKSRRREVIKNINIFVLQSNQKISKCTSRCTRIYVYIAYISQKHFFFFPSKNFNEFPFRRWNELFYFLPLLCFLHLYSINEKKMVFFVRVFKYFFNSKRIIAVINVKSDFIRNFQFTSDRWRSHIHKSKR